MLLPKRTVYTLLFSLVLCNLAFRYPLVAQHELGSDTMFIHTLTSSIVADGRAPWILNPLSFFGLYALSYPSAIPFCFASFSMTSGLQVEATALFFGWVVTIAGALGAFSIARLIRRDDIFALLTAVVFSLSPYLIKDTFWIESTRGFVVALVPAFVLLMIKAIRTNRLADIGVTSALFALLMAIHRMGFLAFFLILAYTFAVPFFKLVRSLRFKFVRQERHVRFGLMATSVGAFVGVLYTEYLSPGITGANIIDQYGTGAFFQGTSFPAVVLNMSISLTGKVGLVLPLVLIGIPASLWRRPKETLDVFVLTTMFVFMPLLAMRDYMAEFLIPLFAIFIATSFLWIRARLPQRRKVVGVALLLIVAGTVAGSWGMRDYWSEHYATDAPILPATYGTAIYLKHEADGILVTNNGLLGGQLAAVSGQPVLPLGGASQHWTSPQQLMWGLVDPATIVVRLIPLANLTFKTDEIYLPINVRNAEVDWETMLYYRVPSQAEMTFVRYDVRYVAVDRTRPDTFLSYAHDRSSPYLASVLPASSYVIYQDSGFTIWYRG